MSWLSRDGHLALSGTCGLLVCLLLVGCSLMTPKKEASVERATSATAEELTTLLRQREAAIHSLKGLFTAKVRGGLIPIASRVEGTVYYRRPDAVRLRGFTPIGGELFEFVQAGDLYKLRLPTMGRVLTGRQAEMATRQELARPFQLSIWAVGGVLGTGAIANGQTVRLAEAGDRYRLDVYADGRSDADRTTPIRRLWFDRRTLFVVQEDRLATNGDVEATIYYEDFRPVEEAAGESWPMERRSALVRPFKISLEDGRGQGSIQITFHEILPNQTIKTEELGEVL